MEKPKASENKAADIETKPPIVMPRKQPEFYALPGDLRLAIVDALLTSSPKILSVGEINKLLTSLSRLRPISINNQPKEKTDKEEP